MTGRLLPGRSVLACKVVLYRTLSSLPTPLLETIFVFVIYFALYCVVFLFVNKFIIFNVAVPKSNFEAKIGIARFGEKFKKP